MIKSFIIIILLIAVTTLSYGQESSRGNTSTPADELNQKAYRFRFSISDSGIYYANKALSLSKKLNYNAGELSAMLNLAISHQTLGNRANALRLALDGKKLAETYHDESWIARFLTVIGVEYHFAGDQPLAIENLRESDRIFEKLQLCNQHVATSWLGMSFLRQQDIDSGFFYCRKALLGTESDSCVNAVITIPLLHLGTAHKLIKNYDSSLYYYKLLLAREKRPTKFTFDAELEIAAVYKMLGQSDSSMYYATLSLNSSINSRLYPQIIAASQFIGSFFEQDDPVKSLEYNNMSILYRDSLEHVRNKTAIDNISDFDEQKRNFELENARKDYRNKLIQISLILGISFILAVAFILRNSNRKKEQANRSLTKALSDLKNTQAQLIQSEKMASLGELTAGIAHEIQNPLNFVNNFSEINNELADELVDELNSGNAAEAKAIAADIKINAQKINEHGKRADAIVKGMLAHSRKSDRQKEPTDINQLADECLRLAYHGMRAKDKTFRAEYITKFGDNVPLVSIISSEISRVMLNLINNAFYAVNERAKTEDESYRPEVIVSTTMKNGHVVITVSDNGNGIPDEIKDKIFQPFFTTKPAGQGTGLGLSLSYDIVKAHGGAILVNTKEGEGSEFIIQLPTN